MRTTKNKQLILEALAPVSHDEGVETGHPPFSASQVAIKLEKDISNVIRSLKTMEQQGLVVAEVRGKDVWNDLKGSCNIGTRKLTCYWRADHIEQDKKVVADHKEQSRIAGNKVFDKLFS